LRQRAEALVPRVGEAPEVSILPNVTLSDVVRLAVLRGLEVLEREFPEK